MKKISRNASFSKQAKDYVDTYRQNISSELQKNKKQKESLLENLEDPEERQAIEKEFRLKMKAYVRDLQSKPGYSSNIYRYKYDMKDVRKFFKMIFSDTQGMKNETLVAGFKASKEHFYANENRPSRTSSDYMVLKKYMEMFTPDQKTEMMEKFDALAKDPTHLAAEFQKIIDTITDPKVLEVVKGVLKTWSNALFLAIAAYLVIAAGVVLSSSATSSAAISFGIVPAFIGTAGVVLWEMGFNYREKRRELAAKKANAFASWT